MDTNSSNASSHRPSMEDTFDNLYPSLLQCFTVILLGYCLGRLGYISPTSSKGIGVFVSLVSLPALLFKSMVELDFSQVNWRFLFSILIAKSTVFVVVVLFTLILVRPTNLGRAGIYGIFSTQSNDLALGYPLLKAIYQEIHPEYVNYLYLMVPVSLIFLNPIGFILMEVSKRQNTMQSVSKLKIAFAAFKDVVTNPIVFMTFIGLVGNFIFHGHLPAVVDQILSGLSQAFLATALFYLGVKMVGTMTTKLGSGLLVPFLLISAKLLILPLITREIIQVLDVGRSAKETESWSMFGFLYGTFPTAPTVAIFAAKFGIEEQLVTSTMVLSTFLSAPVMFISAQMSLLHYTNQVQIDFKQVLNNTMFDVSSTSFPFGVWVIVILLLGRRHKIYPHNYTICLILCQLSVCLSAMLSKIPCQSQFWLLFVSILFYFGCWGSRCWTAMVALCLCLVRCKGDEAVKKYRVWIWLFGWGLPALSCGIVLTLLHVYSIKDKTTPLFIYNLMTKMPTIIGSTILLSLCAVITVIALVKLQRQDRYCKCSSRLQTQCVPAQNGCDMDPQRCNRCMERDQLINGQRNSACCQLNESVEGEPPCNDGGRPQVVDIESLSETTCLVNKVQKQRRHRYSDEEGLSIEVEAIFGGRSVEMDLSVDEYLQGHKHQLGRHVTMILILLLTILMALFLAVWCLLKENTESGIFIALRIVDTCGLFGQNFVVFGCFGFERQLIVIPFLKRWRKLWYGVEVITLPKFEELDPDVIQLCDQFKSYHKQSCQRLIVSDKRYRLRKYKSAFRGDQLVDWLLEVGLATDRQAAVHYGNSLILGRVIRHVTEAHFFYDSPYLYQFCSKRTTGN